MFWHLNTGESLYNWNIFVKLKTRKDLINKNLETEMVLLEIYRLFFMAISPGLHNKCFLLSPVPRIVLLEVVAATQCEELILYDTQDRRRNPAQYQEKPTVTHHSKWKKENHVL